MVVDDEVGRNLSEVLLDDVEDPVRDESLIFILSIAEDIVVSVAT